MLLVPVEGQLSGIGGAFGGRRIQRFAGEVTSRLVCLAQGIEIKEPVPISPPQHRVSGSMDAVLLLERLKSVRGKSTGTTVRFLTARTAAAYKLVKS